MPTIKLTPSGIEVFEGCPFLFKLMHVQRRKPTGPARPSPQLSLGNSVHDCLYLFHKEGGYEKYGPDAIECLLKRSWISGGYPDEDAERAAWQEALQMCQSYYSTFRNEPVQHLGSEMFVESDLNIGDLKVKLSGKIDRLASWPDGHVEVVDYKTSWEPEPSPTKLAGKLTAFLYYLLARLNYPGTHRVDVSYIYLRTMRKVTAVHDPAIGADCKTRLTEAARQIAVADFPAHQNQRCAWCDYTDLCPIPTRPTANLDDIL